MKIPWKTIIGTLGVLGALVWSAYGVDFKELWSIVRNMDPYLTTAVLILTTSNLMIRAVVWKFIVNPLKPVMISHAVSSYLIGVFSNLFLPFKLGDVAQGYTLGRRDGINKISVVSAVFIQRVFEISSLFLIMALIAGVFSFPLIFRRQAIILGLLIVLAISILIIIFRYRKKIVVLMERMTARFSFRIAAGVRRSLEHFFEGTVAIQTMQDATPIMALSLLSWVVQIIMVLLTTNALGLHLDLVSSGIVLLIINIGLTIPIAPGNIGTFQVFSIVALSFFSVDKAQGLAFAIVFQVIQGIPVVIGGSISLLGETLRSKQHVI